MPKTKKIKTEGEVNLGSLLKMSGFKKPPLPTPKERAVRKKKKDDTS